MEFLNSLYGLSFILKDVFDQSFTLQYFYLVPHIIQKILSSAQKKKFPNSSFRGLNLYSHPLGGMKVVKRYGNFIAC